MSIALQLERTSPGEVAVSENVIFNNTAYVSGNISYNDATGVITINETGKYLINWCVATQTSSSRNGAVFGISTSDGDYIQGNSPLKTGIVVGFAVVEATSAPTSICLTNGSLSSQLYAAQNPLRATLVVTNDVSGGTTDSMYCFAVAQMANILSQMITAYAGYTWTIYTNSLYSYSGTPVSLYTSPNATGPGILQLVDINGDYESIPIEQIGAIYPGDGTVYDPSFTYLPAPTILPVGCDTNLIAAIQSYLPLWTSVTFSLGPSVSASGDIYRNEYGVIVLSDVDGNTPIFIFTPQIERIFTVGGPPTAATAAKSSGTKPSIFLRTDKE
jgi:hypothetical protein